MSLLKPAIFPQNLNAAWFDAFCGTINHLLTKEMSAVLSMGKLSGPSDIMVMRFAFKLDGEYAVVTIDSTYLLSVHSSHGTWAYRWQDTGGRPTFLQHLLAINEDYLTKKMNGARPQVFNATEVVSHIKEGILFFRRWDKISKQLARSMYKDASAIVGFSSLRTYRDNYGDVFDDLGFTFDCAHTVYEPGIVNFVSRFWPQVRRALQVVVTELGA